VPQRQLSQQALGHHAIVARIAKVCEGQIDAALARFEM